MNKSQKKDKKLVKRAIRDSLVQEEVEESALTQYDGGDDALEGADGCCMPTANISPDMGTLVIVLNIFLAPIGTLLAAGLDKRGFNKKLLLWGLIYLLPFIIIQILAAQAQAKFGEQAKILEKQAKQANENNDQEAAKKAMEAGKELLKEAANLIVGVVCLAVVNFILWIHGICVACHISRTNKMRVAIQKTQMF